MSSFNCLFTRPSRVPSSLTTKFMMRKRSIALIKTTTTTKAERSFHGSCRSTAAAAAAAVTSPSSYPSGKKVLVVGSGAIGLRTALELARRNNADDNNNNNNGNVVDKICVRSPHHPTHPSTCSMGAGGLWMPVHCDDPRTDRWALETLDELLSFVDTSKNSNNKDKEESDGDGRQRQQRQEQRDELVEIVPAVYLMREHGGPSMDDITSLYGGTDDDSSPSSRVPEPTSEAVYDKLPGWSRDGRLQFQHMTTEMLSWQNNVHRLRIPPLDEMDRAGYKHVWFFRPPVVNTTGMLLRMLRELQGAGKRDGGGGGAAPGIEIDVDVETGRYMKSVEEMKQTASELGCDTVVNCTGLASRYLDDVLDDDLIGARGIVLHFDRNHGCVRRESVRFSTNSHNIPQHPDGNIRDAVVMTTEQPWGDADMPCYLIPRGDAVVVGGSYLEGDDAMSIRPPERRRLLENARNMGIDVSKSPVVREWVGLRPYRPTIRCEIDRDLSDDNVRVVHNYGHGGSGWTINVGAARECADLILRN